LTQLASDKNITENINSKVLTDEERKKNAMNGISESIGQANKNILKLLVKKGSEDEIKQIKENVLQVMDKANKAETVQEYITINGDAKKMFPKQK
jgi:F0F1-type ATP synthase delta subunit